ncbi:TIR domain-containing protein [Saccharothrix saharensis]|uniref:TIR domain-containing protein n=1 Tax=Saccharothrix saharensis TaxID=571190 RepID=UPI00368A9D69
MWIDDELITGDRWENVIRDRIDTCAALVVVMSRDAEESEWVSREIARAQSRGKPVLPLLYDGEVFFRLADVHFEDVRGGRMPGDRFIAVLHQVTDTTARATTTTVTPGRTLGERVALVIAAVGVVSVLVLSWPGVVDLTRNARPDSQTVGTSSTPTGTTGVTGMPTTTGDAPRVDVQVYDNSDVVGLAVRAADDIERLGWKITQKGSYAQGEVPTSTVYFRPGTEEEAAARLLGRQTGLRVEARFSGIDGAAPGLIVIIGNDYRGAAANG